MTGPFFGPGGASVNVPNADQSNTFGLKFDDNIKTSSQAVLAQVEYDLSEQLQVSLGEPIHLGQEGTDRTILSFPSRVGIEIHAG